MSDAFWKREDLAWAAGFMEGEGSFRCNVIAALWPWLSTRRKDQCKKSIAQVLSTRRHNGQ